MKVHISLNVNDIGKSVEFYGKMLNEDPVKYIVGDSKEHIVSDAGEMIGKAVQKSGYAKFDIEN